MLEVKHSFVFVNKSDFKSLIFCLIFIKKNWNVYYFKQSKVFNLMSLIDIQIKNLIQNKNCRTFKV